MRIPQLKQVAKAGFLQEDVTLLTRTLKASTPGDAPAEKPQPPLELYVKRFEAGFWWSSPTWEPISLQRVRLPEFLIAKIQTTAIKEIKRPISTKAAPISFLFLLHNIRKSLMFPFHTSYRQKSQKG